MTARTHPVRLRLGTNQYLHTLGLIAGAVKVAGVELEVAVTATIDECTLRMLKGDFDVAEMSLATFVRVRESRADFVGVPVFAKKLVSQYAFCRVDDTLDGHASLAGRRIAVPQFWVTAAIWHRWYLSDVCGLATDAVTWCPLAQDRIEGMPSPAQFRIDRSLVGAQPVEAVAGGKADCFVFARRPDRIPGLRYLARKPAAATLELVRRTGVVPVTHVLAIRAELLEREPWLAEALLDLFSQSLAWGAKEIGHQGAQYLPLADMQQDEIDATLGRGWNGYGWSANERAVRTFCDAAVRQGLVAAVDIDAAFRRFG